MASISIENVRKLYVAVEAIRGVRSTLPLANSSSSLVPSGCRASRPFLGDGGGAGNYQKWRAIRIGAKPGDRMRRSTEIDQNSSF